MDYAGEDAPAMDHIFQLDNDFGDAGVLAALPKRGMKKQVQAIRHAMMKHDKKT
jgi:hypothetical protein